MRIAIIQPLVPHYREEFFQGISSSFETDIYVYESRVSANNFKVGTLPTSFIKPRKVGRFLFFNFFPLMKENYDIIVYQFQVISFFSSIWLAILCKLYGKKLVLWGHGISISRFLKEERTPNMLLKLQLATAHGAWVYTEKEKVLWRTLFPQKPIVALGNTVSGVEHIIKESRLFDKYQMRKKYGVKEKRVVIFCARFNNAYRRVDLLVDLMSGCPDIGFIIIGDGPTKPDLSSFDNVYDFGTVYEQMKKNELFAMADFYFQPAWVGLSIVEAMAYGKPILTFRRSKDVLQCVEYAYIEQGKNGYIVDTIPEVVRIIRELDAANIETLSEGARSYVQDHLKMSNMVSNAVTMLKSI